MLSSPESFFKELYRPPNCIITADEHQTSFYRPWGFTIYRTCYTPESEEQWRLLIDDIEAEIEDAVIPSSEKDNPSPITRHILSLLHLDFRSDASTLDGLDIDQLRQKYLDSVDGEPMNRHNPNYRVFLLADEEVLSTQPTTVYKCIFDFLSPPDKPWFRFTREVRWFKCVDPEYVAANYIPRNWRAGGQRYFGWFKIETGSVLKLWESLSIWAVSTFAPMSLPPEHLEICKSHDLQKWRGMMRARGRSAKKWCCRARIRAMMHAVAEAQGSDCDGLIVSMIMFGGICAIAAAQRLMFEKRTLEQDT